MEIIAIPNTGLLGGLDDPIQARGLRTVPGPLCTRSGSAQRMGRFVTALDSGGLGSCQRGLDEHIGGGGSESGRMDSGDWGMKLRMTSGGCLQNSG